MKALILAAGYSTRLYPLTLETPKPLLDIRGRPMVDHILDRLAPLGLSEILMVTNQKFYGQFVDWAAPRNVRVLNDGTTSEDNRLGAIGDIAFSIREADIDEPLLVVAGDNLFDFDLRPFSKLFETRRAPVIGLYEFPKRELLSRYGIAATDASGRVIEFLEKPAHPPSNLVAMCLYLLRREDIAGPAQYLAGPDNHDAPGHYIRWLAARQPVFGHRFRGQWYDVGDLASLEEARSVFRPPAAEAGT